MNIQVSIPRNLPELWMENSKDDVDDVQEPCNEGSDVCTHLITLGALLLTVATLPVSLIFVVKVVQVDLHDDDDDDDHDNDESILQEYERAVIFRLGRLLSGGARS